MSIYTLTPEEQEIFESLRLFKFDESLLPPWDPSGYQKEMHPHYGCKHSEETKQLMSMQKLGELNPNFGGISEEHKRKISNGLIGYKHNESAKQSYHFAQNNPEHRKAQSLKAKEYLSDPINMKRRVDQVTLLNKDPENRARKSAKMASKRWCNNGKRNIRVEPEHIPEGFILGKLKTSL